VREVANWSIAWQHPAWRQIASAIHGSELPQPAERVARRPRRLPKRVPRRLWHLFWDVTPSALDLVRHADFVLARILDSADARPVAWLAQSMPSAAFRSVALKTGRLSPEVRRLARVLAGGGAWQN